MYMNDEQIRKDYRRAQDKRAAIRTLAQVNGVSVTAMREHLFLLNEELPPRRQDTADKTRFPVLYRQGLNDWEIAQTAGCSASTVYQWRKRNGLPKNDTRRRRRRYE